jgi:hypothetical protein
MEGNPRVVFEVAVLLPVAGRLFKSPQFDSGSRIMRNRH